MSRSSRAYDPFKDESLGKPFRRVPTGYIVDLTLEEEEALLRESGIAMPDPAPMPPPAAEAAPRRRRRLDWSLAARLLADGSSVEAAAGRLGCTPDRIWRNLRRSRRFRDRIELEYQRRKLQAMMRFRSLDQHAIRQIEARRQDMDPKMLQWLAGATGTGQMPRRKYDRIAEWFGAVAGRGVEFTTMEQRARFAFAGRLKTLLATGRDAEAAALVQDELAQIDAQIARQSQDQSHGL